MKTLIISLLLSFNSFGFGEHMNALEKVLFEQQYKNHVLNGESKNSQVDCVKEFTKAKEKYTELQCAGEGKLIEAGILSAKKFSLDEIENMPAGHPHVKKSLRGTNKIIDITLISGRPNFPHALRACEEFFTENVEVAQIDGETCREITFTAPELGNESYTQTYCAGSLNVFISFN